mgnify:CR=1 FL=1
MICDLQFNLGSTHRTRVRLRVEAAVFDVFELASTLRTHREGRHGGEGAVVWDTGRYGEARSAARAVRERVAVAAIAIVIKLSSKGPVFFRQERVGLDGRPFAPAGRADAERQRRAG